MTDSIQPVNPGQGGEVRRAVYSYVPFSDDDSAVSLSPLQILNALLRQRRWIVAVVLSCTVVGVGATLLLRGWRSEASFAPNASDQGGSQIAGLAAQFGVNIGSLQ